MAGVSARSDSSSVPDAFVGHLLLEREEEVCKPLKCSWFWADPVEVHLLQPQCRVLVRQLVEDGLED